MPKDVNVWIVGSGTVIGKTFCDIFQTMKDKRDYSLFSRFLEYKGIDISSFNLNIYKTDVELDISNTYKVIEYSKGINPDLIINCSSFDDVNLCENDLYKVQSWKENVEGPMNLGIVSNLCDKKPKVIHFSTSYVFDGAFEPYSEGCKPNPVNQYGITKRYGEKRLLEISSNSVIVRRSWIYSKYGNDFLDKVISMILSFDRIYLNNMVMPPPTYVYDLCLSSINLFNTSGVFHISNSGDPISVFDFFKKVADICEFKCEIISGNICDSGLLSVLPNNPSITCFKYESLYGGIRSWEDSLFGFCNTKCR